MWVDRSLSVSLVFGRLPVQYGDEGFSRGHSFSFRNQNSFVVSFVDQPSPKASEAEPANEAALEAEGETGGEPEQAT